VKNGDCFIRRYFDCFLRHKEVIHLLLTDIVMPKMNGKELYDVLKNMQPDLKVVFMSGYASNLVGGQNIIAQHTNFIQKPFSLHKLSDIVRRALI
jgi:DNA-binding NtrC family response regulator